MGDLRARLDYCAGQVCKFLFPVDVDFFKGNGLNVSICTLSSIDLLKAISKSELMNKLVIAGRLFSENKGVDQIIRYCLNDSKIEYIVLCGKDTKGHFPGDALINLLKNGVTTDCRILGTVAPYPFISTSKEDVAKFTMQISVIDLRNCFDIDKISDIVHKLAY